MIVDLKKFIEGERAIWEELDKTLTSIENDALFQLTLENAQRLQYLYERTGAGLIKISTFAAEPNLVQSLEALLARAYAEVREGRSRKDKLSVSVWLSETFPQTFRRHLRFFIASLALTILGASFGAVAVKFDPDAKAAIVPFPHLLEDPAARVKEEESGVNPALAHPKGQFSSVLMTNNIRISILALALGATWGIGTVILLFYNGVILGAIICDYLRAGQSAFLMGWLLPHGVIEIPAILIAGQAGLLLGQALIGWNSNEIVSQRLRSIAQSVTTLITGTAILLVWAGFVEAFLSQYHEPVLPYSFKIAFGMAEFAALIFYLTVAGSRTASVDKRSNGRAQMARR
jgi:uncharacterized membrane protein SpoIIM required for sporulation